MKQHFVEWFSGSALDSIWTETLVTGTPTFTMADAVDEGFAITTSAGVFDSGSINFNDKRPFSNTGSVIIVIPRCVESTNRKYFCGLADGVSLGNNYAVVLNETGLTNYAIITNDGSGSSTIESSIVTDEVFRVCKIELDGTDAKLTIDGSLEVTKTTDLPTTKLQPIFRVENKVATVRNYRIKYLEAYNT
jgi:hypothetical protein